MARHHPGPRAALGRPIAVAIVAILLAGAPAGTVRAQPSGDIATQLNAAMQRLAIDLLRLRNYLAPFDQIDRMAVAQGQLTAAEADNRLRQKGNELFHNGVADAALTQLLGQHREAVRSYIAVIENQVNTSTSWPNGARPDIWQPLARDRLQRLHQQYDAWLARSLDPLPVLEDLAKVAGWTRGMLQPNAQLDPFAGQRERLIAAIPGPLSQRMLSAALPASRPPPAPTPPGTTAAIRHFDDPTVQGVALDYCATWASDCGKPAADAFCRSQGFTSASEFVPRFHAPPTRVIGSGQICNADFCGRIASVTCGGGSAATAQQAGAPTAPVTLPSAAPQRTPSAPAAATEPILQDACGQYLGPGLHAKWHQLGERSGILGCPLTTEASAAPSPQGTTGSYAEFGKGDGGIIVLHGSGGHAGTAYEVHGCAYKVYKQLGGTAGQLGFPVGEAHAAPGGQRSDFEGGYIEEQTSTRRCTAYATPRGPASPAAAGAGATAPHPAPAGAPAPAPPGSAGSVAPPSASKTRLWVTDANFETAVLRAAGPVLVIFCTHWAPSCVEIDPRLDELAARLDGKVTVAEMEVDKNPEAARRYVVSFLPTLLLFNGGHIVTADIGILPGGKDFNDWLGHPQAEAARSSAAAQQSSCLDVRLHQFLESQVSRTLAQKICSCAQKYDDADAIVIIRGDSPTRFNQLLGVDTNSSNYAARKDVWCQQRTGGQSSTR